MEFDLSQCACLVIILYKKSSSALPPSSPEDPKKNRLRRLLIHIGVKVLGAILDLVQFIETPLGAALAIAVVTASYFYGRWVFSD
jgi:hypothetical protein